MSQKIDRVTPPILLPTERFSIDGRDITEDTSAITPETEAVRETLGAAADLIAIEILRGHLRNEALQITQKHLTLSVAFECPDRPHAWTLELASAEHKARNIWQSLHRRNLSSWIDDEICDLVDQAQSQLNRVRLYGDGFRHNWLEYRTNWENPSNHVRLGVEARIRHLERTP